MMKLIFLTQGKFSKIDDSDYENVSKMKWHAASINGSWYARRTTKSGSVGLHQFLCPGWALVDHTNQDGLDNQRHNLRDASHAQNSANKRKTKRGSSRFKGVYWYSDKKKWRAQVQKGGKLTFLGYFDDETDAARAYDAEARNQFGEFASPNFS